MACPRSILLLLRDAHIDHGQEASKSAKYKLHFLLGLADVLRGLTAGLPRCGGVLTQLADVLCCLAAGIRFPSVQMRPVGRCVRLPSRAVRTVRTPSKVGNVGNVIRTAVRVLSKVGNVICT